MFFRKTASVLAPKLSCLFRRFRRLLRCGEFLLEWRIAYVTPIPKGPLSAFVCNYRPISIISVLSMVFERLIALRFGRFLERSGVLSYHQYSYIHTERVWVPVMLFWTSSVLCQLELDRGGERPLTVLIMRALCLNCGKLELVACS